MNKWKKRIIWIIILTVLIGAGFWFFQGREKKIEYTTIEAQKGKLAETVSVTGEVQAVNQSDLAFQGSGIVEAVYFSIGDRVAKDDKLATLSASVLAEQLRQARSDFQAQKDTLEAMRRKPSAYSHFQKKAQEEVIKKYEAALAAVYRQFGELNIYAPFDGVVVRREIDPRENAVGNVTVISVADIRELELEANVPESDIVKVALGQSAEVTFDAFSLDEKFEAKVTNIEPASTVIQDVVYYKVTFKLADPDDRLKVGMSSDIDIRIFEKDNIVMVPARAIKSEGGRKYVEVLKDEKNNIVDKIFITTGLAGDEGMTEITSGLSGGEKIITLEKEE